MNAVVRNENENEAPQAGMVRSPFAGTIATRSSSNASADTSQAREIAEVQGAMVIAQRFPRDPITAMDRILRACTRPSLAEGALYSYSRGGQEITGPSIRLAETAAQAWGNMAFGIRELEQRNGASTVEAFAWDMESNTRQVKVFQVEHKRHTKKGAYKLEDPRDIYELVANQGARRLRSCILGVIPGDVIEAAVKQCEETMHASADTSPDALKKIVDAFQKFGVTREQIEKRIQCRLDAIRPAQVVQLKKVYASLRDGMSVASDWFEQPADAEDVPKPGVEGVKQAVKSRAENPKQDSEKGPAITTEEILDALVAAKDRDSLDVAADLIRMLPENDQCALRDVYEQRKGEIQE